MSELVTTPDGRVPLECIDPQAHPRKYLSGTGLLTWPPRMEYLDGEGQPRRIEWVDDIEWAQYQVRAYSPPVFRIAHDLVQQEHDRAVLGQVETAIQRLMTSKQLSIEDPRIEALRDEVKALREEVEALKAPKPRRRAARTDSD